MLLTVARSLNHNGSANALQQFTFYVICLIYFLVYFSRNSVFEAWPWPTIFIHGGG